jgi:hypothetical protein
MKECTKIVDHLNVFNTLICQLTSMDVKIYDEDKEIKLLCPLPKSSDHLVTYISFSTNDTLNYDCFFRSFLFEEVQR